MRKLFRAGLCCSVVWIWLSACHDPPPRTLIVRAGRLWDGTDQPVRTHQRLTLHDGEITSITADSDAPIPPDAAVLDATELTVMPGMIDAHVHTLGSPRCTPGEGAGPAQAVRNLRAWLAAGVTTVADLTDPTSLALSVRRYAGVARSRGPRVLTCGAGLAAPGGYPRTAGTDITRQLGFVTDVAGPEAARTAVRDLADAGVDCVKVFTQSRNFDDTQLPALDTNTLCSIVAEAHRQELPVFVHAQDNAAYAMALACGVDALAHGPNEPLSEPVKAALLAHPLPVTPTHWVFEAPFLGPRDMSRLETPIARIAVDADGRADLQRYADALAAPGDMLPDSLFPHVPRAAIDSLAAAHMANTRWLFDHGQSLAYGSDTPFCFNWAGDVVRELERFRDAGIPAPQVLKIATQGSARSLGLDDALGKIAVGWRADLIAVAGKPDENIADLAHVEHVIIDGIHQDTAPHWNDLPLLLWQMLSTWMSR